MEDSGGKLKELLNKVVNESLCTKGTAQELTHQGHENSSIWGKK